MFPIIVFAALVASWLTIRWLNALSRPHHTLGVASGQLAKCPDSPNCVSTTSARPDQSMPTIPFTGSAADAMNALKSVIGTMPRSRIITADEHYLHAEFRSRVFGYVDDVEFFIHAANAVIHFRSSSRIGYSDLGANRERMLEIRERFERSRSNAH